MSKGNDKPGSGGSGGAGRPRYVLPSDLSGSLRHLDDDQLDRLLRSVAGEARRRGRPVDDEASASPRSGSGKTPTGVPPAGGKSRARLLPIPPGQAKVIRAAFEAGVKPATIARQLRVSRAQVEQVIGRAKGRKR